MPLLEEVVTLKGVDNENSLTDLFCNPIVNILNPSALKTTALGFESLDVGILRSIWGTPSCTNIVWS